MKKIVIGICTIMLLLGVTGCGCSKEKKPEEIIDKPAEGNTNEGVIKDQIVGNLKLTNTSLIIENGQSQLTTTVTNDTDTDIRVETFDIYVKDENGNIITTLLGYVGGMVPKHSSRQVISNCIIDLSHATSIEYHVNES